MSIDSITWASDQTELKRLRKAKVFNETRSSHDAVGRGNWKASVLLWSSKNIAKPPHAVKCFSWLRVSGSSRRCRTAIGLFPTEQWGSKKRHYHVWLCINSAQRSGQQLQYAANVACVPVSCIETTWEAPMWLARMREEPKYDMEKFGEAAEATNQGYRPTTQAQQETST